MTRNENGVLVVLASNHEVWIAQHKHGSSVVDQLKRVDLRLLMLPNPHAIALTTAHVILVVCGRLLLIPIASAFAGTTDQRLWVDAASIN